MILVNLQMHSDGKFVICNFLLFFQVMVMKESAAPLFSPAPVPRKSPVKSQAPQVNHAQVSAAIAETPVSGSDAADNGSNQEGEGMQTFIIVGLVLLVWILFQCISDLWYILDESVY